MKFQICKKCGKKGVFFVHVGGNGRTFECRYCKDYTCEDYDDTYCMG